MCIYLLGCINANLARQLYSLGPNCASSDLRTLRLTGIPLEFTKMLSGGSRKDWLFTRTSPVQSAVVLLEVCICVCVFVRVHVKFVKSDPFVAHARDTLTHPRTQ